MDADLLIVGAGPVGMLGGILAARHGLSAVVVERRTGPQTAPAAHVVNARTYEIFRQAGLDMPRIHAAGKDRSEAGHVNFVTRLGGDLIGRLPFERQGDACLEVTPTPLRNLSQHRLEPILADELRASSGVELRYGIRWEDAEDQGTQVRSEVVDAATGERRELRTRYVIGCDGAGSRVRKHLGIEMIGPPLLQYFLMIHFRADLRPLIADRPGVLHFTLDPEANGAFVAHDPGSDWVYMHGIDPDEESVEDYPDERCHRVIDNAAGVPLDAEVIGKGTWRMSAQTAADMGKGRIFLAGDAAHRFPPTGGLGLNSGVQDIHGLLWRLGAIVRGGATEPLLDSYATERLPVAQNNASQSVTNALRMVALPAALGTDLEPTTARLHASLADPSKADAIAAAVEEQREHFDLFGLQLGYVYEDGAVVADGAPHESPSPSVFEPTARPGARLPHAWLDRVGGRSTLDLVPLDRPVLIGVGAHDRWGEAARRVGIDHVRIGVDIASLPTWSALCELGETGALLVRPDQHVAWRAHDVDAADGLSLAASVISGRVEVEPPALIGED
ncbi:MAG: FAD-dependent monooxygenase [Actinomycetota bacterium]